MVRLKDDHQRHGDVLASASPQCYSTDRRVSELRSFGMAEGAAPVGQDAVELPARLDVELGEDFLQVILHGAGADEQPRADLRVRVAVAGHPPIWASCAVSICASGAMVRLRAVSPVACSSRWARPANRSMPISSNMSCAQRS